MTVSSVCINEKGDEIQKKKQQPLKGEKMSVTEFCGNPRNAAIFTRDVRALIWGTNSGGRRRAGLIRIMDSISVKCVIS